MAYHIKLAPMSGRVSLIWDTPQDHVTRDVVGIPPRMMECDCMLVVIDNILISLYYQTFILRVAQIISKRYKLS